MCGFNITTLGVEVNGQVFKGNLDEKSPYQDGNALGYNEMQLINKNDALLTFKRSLDKETWIPEQLNKNDYIVVKFTVNENYCYIKLCTESANPGKPLCDDYRLQRKERYIFKRDNENHKYTVGILKP